MGFYRVIWNTIRERYFSAKHDLTILHKLSLSHTYCYCIWSCLSHILLHSLVLILRVTHTTTFCHGDHSYRVWEDKQKQNNKRLLSWISCKRSQPQDIPILVLGTLLPLYFCPFQVPFNPRITCPTFIQSGRNDSIYRGILLSKIIIHHINSTMSFSNLVASNHSRINYKNWLIGWLMLH